MGETYEGITVPEGQPEDVTAAAARLDGASGMVDGALARLNSLPGSMATWQGPASAAFAGTAQQQAAAARSAGQAIDTGVSALRGYAHVLHQAQHDGEEADRAARLAAQGLAAQMQGAAGGVMPFAAGLGGPATAATGGRAGSTSRASWPAGCLPRGPSRPLPRSGTTASGSSRVPPSWRPTSRGARWARSSRARSDTKP